MRLQHYLIAMLVLGVSAAGAGPISAPPLPPERPVTETLYGRTVVDPYRYMEQLGPETIDWMKAQGRYTRQVFDSMPGHARLARDMAAYTSSIASAQDYQAYGGRTFYQERAPGSDNFSLMVREPGGRARTLVDVASLRAAHGGAPYAIDYYTASPDGTKVAVGVSEGGSEDASLSVYDATSGRQIAGPLDRAHAGAPSWTEDSRGLFVTQLQVTRDRLAKYANETAAFWDLKSAPRPLVGASVAGAVTVQPTELPRIAVTPGSGWAKVVIHNGTQNEREVWLTPAANAASPTAKWRKVASFDDDVTQVDQRGDEVFLLSHKDAPTFKVLRLKAGRPLAEAETVLAARPDRLVEAISAARDALYVEVREGLYSHLLRLPASGGPPQELPLPAKGSIDPDMFTDARRPGVVIKIEGWTTPPTRFSYDPRTRRFSDLRLGPRPRFDPSRYVVQERQATAKDGVKVPLSFFEPKGLPHPGIVVLFAYGAYGVAEFPFFSERWTFYLQHGVAVGECHPRGGGELGEAWRLGGKDATKPNTWRDLIACGEDIIARGEATPKSLFILGGSAGGVAIGRAMEERPDLFAGVIDAVPVANTLRTEFSPNGPPNIPEFGTIKTEAGFNNLYAMDSYQHVEAGVRYPPVLITTGLNDPRVDPWQPAKLAARLMANRGQNPVLLRVDETGGHGMDATKTQDDELYTDILSFVFWQSGRADFQPR